MNLGTLRIGSGILLGAATGAWLAWAGHYKQDPTTALSLLGLLVLAGVVVGVALVWEDSLVRGPHERFFESTPFVVAFVTTLIVGVLGFWRVF